MDARISSLTVRATLGGLIHDIGKPWTQASGRGPQDSRFDCQTESQHTSFDSCPSCKKLYRSAHAPLGAKLLSWGLPKPAYLQELALTHHAVGPVAATGGKLLEFVKFGDQLAAAERDDDEPAGTSQQRPALLNPYGDGGRWHRPLPLTSRGLLETGTDPRVLPDDYQRLIQTIRGALPKAGEYAGDDELALVDGILGVIDLCAGMAPSAFWESVADISLAAHLQLAGAFAGALAAADIPPSEVELDADSSEVATLITGDISGIQTFIHRTASKRAARSLRARSFYLTLLSTLIARHIAEELGVTGANVLWASGGNFQILGPAGSADRLAEIADSIDRALIHVHGVALSVSLASIPVKPVDTRRFSALLRESRLRLGAAKARRYERSAAALALFQPRADGGQLRPCRSCGGDASHGREDEDGRICPFCDSLEALGRQLPEAGYVTVERSQPVPGSGWQAVFQRLGLKVEVRQNPPPSPFPGAIYALDTASLLRLPCARLLPCGRRVPLRKDGGLMEFREIAECAEGKPLLAFVKLDVDDLGDLLRTHFQRNGRVVTSPSRLGTFSKFLSLFFEGRLNDLAADDFPQVYMVFAGGDDAVAIGPWDQVLAFAMKARQEFRVWTAENSAFHFSAGIAFGDSSRPVMQGLEEAERMLDRAKEQPGKDRVTLFGYAMKWQDLEEVVRWQKQLVDLIRGTEEGRVARSLLRRLKALEKLVPEQPDGEVKYCPELWRAYYHLKRFAERHSPARGFTEKIYDKALQPRGALKLAMAARLAEFASWHPGEGRV